MKNKLVKIHTIYDEEILCIVVKEDSFNIYYKNEDSTINYVPKIEIKYVDVIGDVVNE